MLWECVFSFLWVVYRIRFLIGSCVGQANAVLWVLVLLDENRVRGGE